jgi:hypothetical protein
MLATFLIVLSGIGGAVIVLQKWAKDTRREEDESQTRFNQYEDDWIKIHRD